MFNEAAGDVAKLVMKRSCGEIATLRQIGEIRFAKTFSEAAFAGYVEERGGRVTLTGLPDRDDPMLARIRAIQVRDGLFMDRMQTHYEGFARRTDTSYAALNRGDRGWLTRVDFGCI